VKSAKFFHADLADYADLILLKYKKDPLNLQNLRETKKFNPLISSKIIKPF